jgi:class 3 adenylate cyclase
MLITLNELPRGVAHCRETRHANAALAKEAGTDAPGVGINTGRCTVGNFGSSHRFDYWRSSDAVNVAARLEAETREYGTAILIGGRRRARCRHSRRFLWHTSVDAVRRPRFTPW